MPAAEENLTEQLNVALTPGTMKDLKTLRRRTGIRPTDFARTAIVEKVASVADPLVSSEEAKAVTELRRLAGESAPIEALQAAIAEKLSNP